MSADQQDRLTGTAYTQADGTSMLVPDYGKVNSLKRLANNRLKNKEDGIPVLIVTGVAQKDSLVKHELANNRSVVLINQSDVSVDRIFEAQKVNGSVVLTDCYGQV